MAVCKAFVAVVINIPVPGGQRFGWTVDDKLMVFEAPAGMSKGDEYEFEFTEAELAAAPIAAKTTVADAIAAAPVKPPKKKRRFISFGRKKKKGSAKAGPSTPEKGLERKNSETDEPELDPDNKNGTTKRQASFARRLSSNLFNRA